MSKRLQAELEETKGKLKINNGTDKVTPKKKAPMLSVLGKSSSGEVGLYGFIYLKLLLQQSFFLVPYTK